MYFHTKNKQMKLITNIFTSAIILLVSASLMQAQCEFEKNESNESKGGKLVITHSELLYNKGNGSKWRVIYGGISNFYDGLPKIELMVCLRKHFHIEKGDDVVFHFKNGKSINRKNYLAKGARKSRIGSGTTYCATYSVNIDDEIKETLLSEKSKSSVVKLEFTHNKGKEVFKLKKKYSKRLAEHASCAFKALDEKNDLE